MYLTHILRGTKKYKIYGHFEGFPLQQRQLFSKRKNQEVCNLQKKLGWWSSTQFFVGVYIFIHVYTYIFYIHPMIRIYMPPIKGWMGILVDDPSRGLDPWRIHLHQPTGSLLRWFSKWPPWAWPYVYNLPVVVQFLGSFPTRNFRMFFVVGFFGGGFTSYQEEGELKVRKVWSTWGAFWLSTWRIVPLSKWLGSPPFIRHGKAIWKGNNPT